MARSSRVYRTSRLALAIGCVLIATASVHAHPFHTSTTEVELNPKTRSLEIAIRIAVQDLERVLSLRARGKVRLDDSPEISTQTLDYLARVLVFDWGKDRKGKMQPVGKELEGSDVWLYLEVPLPDGIDTLAGAQITHKLSMRLFIEQVNTVNFRHGDKRCTLNFTQEKPSMKVEWAKPSASSPKS